MTGRKLLPGKEIPPSEIPDYSIDRRDSSEIYADAFIKHMKVLNNFVQESGEVLEGGIGEWRGAGRRGDKGLQSAQERREACSAADGDDSKLARCAHSSVN